MPTIEIISLNCLVLPKFPKFDGFAYISENGVKSHRGLFQDILDKQYGVIIHLGNKDFEGEEDGPWFAGKIVNWDYEEKCIINEHSPVIFYPDVFAEIVDIMHKLLDYSPDKKIIFLTDYQFGGEPRIVANNFISISEFISLHKKSQIYYNSLYYIEK